MAASADQLKISQEFLRVLKSLMKDLVDKAPGDAVIARTQKRLIIAADLWPTQMVQWTGEALFPFNENIFSESPDEWQKFFTPGKELDTVRETARQSGSAADRVDAEYIIDRVQHLARNLGRAEQEGYIARVRVLLELYLDFNAD